MNVFEVFLLLFVGVIVGVAFSMIVYTHEWMEEQDKIKELKQSNNHLKDMLARMELEKQWKDVYFEED